MQIRLAHVLLLTATAHAAVLHLGYNYEQNNVVSSNGIDYKDTENLFKTQPLENTKPVFNSRNYQYLPPERSAQSPIITKQFFLVSAPEEHNETPITKHFVIGRPQKNYRVVFIKAPSSENSKIKLSAEYASQEEKTVIYVLSRKSNDLDISDISEPKPTTPSKPEVFFIKYKTPEEAAAAQKDIQDQYDQLGGTTEYSDEGVVPVKSVIGSVDALATKEGYNYKPKENNENSVIKDFLQAMRYYY